MEGECGRESETWPTGTLVRGNPILISGSIEVSSSSQLSVRRIALLFSRWGGAIDSFRLGAVFISKDTSDDVQQKT